jgi:hypothetical protein
MTAKLRSWWQYIRKHWIVAIIVVFVVLMALIFVGYWFDWTGFSGYNKVTIAHIISGTNAGTATKTEEYQPGKSLWDWLQLLGILAPTGCATRLMKLHFQGSNHLCERS